jgi:Concanavalin A-like lectin/glucanases superfamily
MAIMQGARIMNISSSVAKFGACIAVAVAAQFAAGPLRAELIGFWNFDDMTANDSSGKGHHGTLAGTAAIVVDSVRGNVLSLTESDADSDGDGKVDLGNPAGLNITGGQASIAAWVNAAKIPQNPSGGSAGNAGIVQRGHEGSGGAGTGREFVLRYGIGGASYQFGTWNGTNRHATFVAPTEDVNQWVHLAGTITDDGGGSSTYRLYRNGAEVANFPSALPLFSDFQTGWSIGSRGGVAAIERGFAGLLDDVRIYDHALSLTEIAEIMTPGDPPVLGDTDGDEVVEFEDDFGPIRDNFRNAVTSRAQGDLVANGRVDFDDFRQWKTAFLATGGSLAGLDLSFGNVPEPSALFLSILGLLWFCHRAPRRLYNRI